MRKIFEKIISRKRQTFHKKRQNKTNFNLHSKNLEKNSNFALENLSIVLECQKSKASQEKLI